MIKINEAIIVEGKYDKIKLSQIVDAVIISVNGFNIFKDNAKQIGILKWQKFVISLHYIKIVNHLKT